MQYTCMPITSVLIFRTNSLSATDLIMPGITEIFPTSDAWKLEKIPSP
jgi:hypothetical protein